MKLGIMGAGIIGSATGRVLGRKHEIMYYDKFKPEYQDISRIANEAEVTFTCVPTPMKPSGEIDYSAIHNSLDFLLENVLKSKRNPRDIISVIRSTAVSGTTDKLAQRYPFRFAFNPEFLMERHAEEDMTATSRIVIGANSQEVSDTLLVMYKEVFPAAEYFCTDIKTAEMIKYAANVTLAAQIAIANEIYQICQAVGVDYGLVRNIILLDKRIGGNTEVPGPDGDFGFGGKCFPKDINALIHLAREHHFRPYLLEEIWRSNLAVRKGRDWLNITVATTQNMENFTVYDNFVKNP